jgi:hypothetical protein
MYSLVTQISKALVVICLLATTIVTLTLSADAQKQAPKVTTTPTPTPTPTPESLTLTAAEQKQRDELFTNFQQLEAARNNLLLRIVEAKDEDAALGFWARAVRVHTDLTAAQNKLIAWIDSVKRAHSCPTCELKGNSLVPAEASSKDTK